MGKYSYEKLDDEISVCISAEHRFGTDAFLLADFAAPRRKDVVCDLGTGCGIIPMIMCKKYHPAKIFGVDIQPQAIEQFNRSLEVSTVTSEVIPALCDLNSLSKDIFQAGRFDIVTCNPPYKAENSGILSESQADQIARHETTCTIDDVCSAASNLLRFGGKLVICQRPERLADVITSMRTHDIEPKRLRFVAKDYQSPPWLFLIEGKKGSKPFMQIEPMFKMYQGNEYSSELKKVYGVKEETLTSDKTEK